MTARNVTATADRVTPKCAKCGSEKISPSWAKRRTYYRCAKCINASPAGKRARAKWLRANGWRRIYAGGRPLGYAPTLAVAEQMRDHRQARVRAYREQRSATQ